MHLYFSDYFDVAPAVLEQYGAFNISVVSDLPLFVDPFLLFNSSKPEYQQLHVEIIRYLVFLRDHASADLDEGLIAAWYRFKEVKQNWLGFTLLGNGGQGLGAEFARSLHASLGTILSSFGAETATRSPHLEKISLVRGGVGRDGISDFTTNLIKGYLLDFTTTFGASHLTSDQCRDFAVPRAEFNYTTESWTTKTYRLPALGQDFVLLTPVDMLTRDDTWISHGDMLRQFHQLPAAVPDVELRGQINNYFRSRLSRKPKAAEVQAAAQATITRFPQLIDLYIRMKEEQGDQAQSIAEQRVIDTHSVLVEQLGRASSDLESKTDFYSRPWSSYDEALERALLFKHYVEHQDGYRLINRAGQPFAKESEVQIFFGLLWCKTDFDVNREPNNGRGPVDFKVSFGSGDKSLIEFKLASNSSLKRNLEKQVAIYEAANKTSQSVKVIISYTAADERKVDKVLRELKLTNEPSLVRVDARSDNKPSASRA